MPALLGLLRWAFSLFIIKRIGATLTAKAIGYRSSSSHLFFFCFLFFFFLVFLAFFAAKIRMSHICSNWPATTIRNEYAKQPQNINKYTHTPGTPGSHSQQRRRNKYKKKKMKNRQHFGASNQTAGQALFTAGRHSSSGRAPEVQAPQASRSGYTPLAAGGVARRAGQKTMGIRAQGRFREDRVQVQVQAPCALI